MLGGGQFDGFAFAIERIIAAIGRGAQAGQFHNGVHGFEQFAVMADHNGAAAPFGQKIDDCIAAIAIEIVGGFVEQQEIGIGEHQRSQHGAGALAARESFKLRFGGCGQGKAGEGFIEPRFDRPVGIGQLVGCSGSGSGAGEDVALGGGAEQVGYGLASPGLERLAQQADGAIDGDAARLRDQRAGDQPQDRRFAHTVAAHKAGALARKGEIEIGEKLRAVRR